MTEKRLRKKAALNVLCTKEMETYPKYNSKYNSTRQKKIFPIWWSLVLHYLAIKKLSVSMRGINSKNISNFYCLNCFHSFTTKNKPKCHEKVCKNKGLGVIIFPTQKENILAFK